MIFIQKTYFFVFEKSLRFLITEPIPVDLVFGCDQNTYRQKLIYVEGCVEWHLLNTI